MKSALDRSKGSRKRTRTSLDFGSSSATTVSKANEPKQKKKNQPIICLTGFSQDEKEYYHGLIQKLGGSYTRTLDATVNTHLMAKVPEGPKYEAAVEFAASLSSSTPLQIVRSSWLRDCVEQQKWVEVRPQDHCHDRSKAATDLETEDLREIEPQLPTTENDPPAVPLLEMLEQVTKLGHDRDCISLFSPFQFIFVGFEDGSEELIQLSRLVRRGLGRIAWNFNDQITHVVIPDASCDETVRDAAKIMHNEHPNSPAVIAPLWILTCWEKKEVVEPSSRIYGPSFLPKESLTAVTKKTKKQKMAVPPKSNMFRGCIFAFLRVAPPTWAVDYSSKELETLILAHSGQVLSNRIVEALTIDSSGTASRGGSSNQYKCYVVCWGGAGVDSNLNMHPTLGQVKRGNLCDMIQVTPNWVQTCCSESKLISRSKCPTFFKPLSWPVRRLVVPGPEKTATKKKKSSLDESEETKSIHVAISGIRGSLRTAIVHWIQALGATHDDAMERGKTTHLISSAHETNEVKLEKAEQWNISIVSLEWIFHVSQYGYSGKDGKDGSGCESKFAVAAKK